MSFSNLPSPNDGEENEFQMRPEDVEALLKAAQEAENFVPPKWHPTQQMLDVIDRAIEQATASSQQAEREIRPEAEVQNVVNWMVQKIMSEGILPQSEAVTSIQSLFGQGFTYINRNQNRAVSPLVLAAFRRATESTVVWVRSEKIWRIRRLSDPNSRQV